jgi:ribosomal protein S12 methylthiotransferase accessory factor
MVSREPGWPAAVVATAADLDPERAITRALQELSANHLYIRAVWENSNNVAPQAPHQVVSQEDHGLFYCSPERLSALDMFLRPRSMIRPQDLESHAVDDVKANIDFCVKRLAELDLEVIAVDLTTPDVADLGFKVFKVLVPGLQPIDFGVQWPHIGGRRLYEAPVRMGFDEKTPQDLNYFPHPFP